MKINYYLLPLNNFVVNLKQKTLKGNFVAAKALRYKIMLIY